MKKYSSKVRAKKHIEYCRIRYKRDKNPFAYIDALITANKNDTQLPKWALSVLSKNFLALTEQLKPFKQNKKDNALVFKRIFFKRHHVAGLHEKYLIDMYRNKPICVDIYILKKLLGNSITLDETIKYVLIKYKIRSLEKGRNLSMVSDEAIRNLYYRWGKKRFKALAEKKLKGASKKQYLTKFASYLDNEKTAFLKLATPHF